MTIDNIKEIVKPIAEKYNVIRMGVFGSVARGEENQNSDIDFVVELLNPLGFQFFSMVDDLEKKLDKKVDVLTYNSIRDFFIASALEDEIVVYEKR